MKPAFVVADRGTSVSITRQLLLEKAGESQAIASALAFRLFCLALDDLTPGAAPERSSISVLTALPGQGFLDCVRFVITSRGRLAVDERAGPEAAPASVVGRFYFEFEVGGRRRGYWPNPGLFDNAFRDKVARFQDAACTIKEARAYQDYKRGLSERILGESREKLFSHADLDATRPARL